MMVSSWNYIVVLMFFVGFLPAQEDLSWRQNVGNPHVSFQSIIDNYEKEKAINGPSYHLGYDEFERWKHLWSNKLDANGFVDYKTQQKTFLQGLTVNNASSKDFEDVSWTALGPTSLKNSFGVGRINVVAFHPENNNLIYAGAPSGGFWISEDGGLSWNTTTDNLINLGISDIAIDPNNPNIIYAATGDRDNFATATYGIIKSTNGGYDWELTSFQPGFDALPEFWEIHRILIDDNSQLTVASSNGIWISNDEAQSWIRSEIPDIQIKHLEYNPQDHRVLYASSVEQGARYFRSNDSGKSFREISIPSDTKVNRIAIAVCPQIPNHVYLLSVFNDPDGSNDFSSILFSDDRGMTFTEIEQEVRPELGGQTWYDLSFGISYEDELTMYIGAVDFLKSVDGGSSWYTAQKDENISVQAEHHFIGFRATDGKLFVATDGGIYASENQAETWEFLSEGMNITQYYRVAVSDIDKNMILAGAQDNGTHLYNGEEWNRINGANGMDCQIDPTDPDRIYVSSEFGDFYTSKDKGLVFNASINSNVTGSNGALITPIAINESEPQELFVGYQSVWRSRDHGLTWEEVSQNFGSDIQAITVSNVNPLLIYAATITDFWRSTNGGNSWSRLSTIPNCCITDIEAHPENQQIVYITAGNSVYFSKNRGKVWDEISGEIGGLAKNAIVVDKDSDESLYLATDHGVYFKNDFHPNWEIYGDNLPRVRVRDIEIAENFDLLRVATYGRGIWESFVYQEEICDGILSILSPINNDELDNLCTAVDDDQISWSFQWTSCPQAQEFKLRIDGPNEYSHVEFLNENSFTFSTTESFDDSELEGWTVRVKAKINDVWKPYSEKINFRLEKLNNDCDGLTCNEAKEINIPGDYMDLGPSSGGGGLNDGQAINASWYSFKATSDGTIDILSCFGGTDTRLWLYEGDCQSLDLIASNDDECDMGTGDLYAAALYGVEIEKNKTYFIEWDGQWSSNSFEWSVNYQLNCDLASEDFDNYEMGEPITILNAPFWQIPIDNPNALSGFIGGDLNEGQALMISNIDNTNTDINHLINTGKATAIEYKISLYVPKDQQAFIGVLNQNGPDRLVHQLVFNNDGAVLFDDERVSNYPSDSWFDISFLIDLYGDISFFIDGRKILDAPYNANSFQAINYWGGLGAYFVDNICVSQFSEQCVADLNLDNLNADPTGTAHRASKTININGRVTSDQQQLLAGECISLEPGFELDNKLGFEVSIDNCEERLDGQPLVGNKSSQSNINAIKAIIQNKYKSN